MSEYTKGPWRIDLYGDHNERFAIEGKAFDDTWRWIVDRVRGGNKSQTVANARLIAAAPEMAEMLSDALRWLKGVHDIYGAEALGESKPMNCAGLNEMRDVLKKAGVL